MSVTSRTLTAVSVERNFEHHPRSLVPDDNPLRPVEPGHRDGPVLFEKPHSLLNSHVRERTPIQNRNRVHVRGPSFGNLQGLPTMIVGSLIADVIASLGSMDFVLGDSDR